ncbi:MAG: hypothetical protein V8S28_07910 [Lachnospiraceae bacterium]
MCSKREREIRILREKISNIYFGIGLIIVAVCLYMINFTKYANAKLTVYMIYFGLFLELIAVILKQPKFTKRRAIVMAVSVIVILMIAAGLYYVATMI